MSTEQPDRLGAAHARLLAAESHLARATDRLRQIRQRVREGNADEPAMRAALEGYLRAAAAAHWARNDYERLTEPTTVPDWLAAIGALLGVPAPESPAPMPATPTPPASEEAPAPYVPYVPEEQERRRWEFARWLIQTGRLTEFPA